MSEQQGAQAAKHENFHSTNSQAGRTTEPSPYQCQGDERVAQHKGPCCFLIELGRSRCRRVAGPAGFFYENILLEPAVMTSFLPRFFKFSPSVPLPQLPDRFFPLWNELAGARGPERQGGLRAQIQIHSVNQLPVSQNHWENSHHRIHSLFHEIHVELKPSSTVIRS